MIEGSYITFVINAIVFLSIRSENFNRTSHTLTLTDMRKGFATLLLLAVGRDSSVGIATRYGLDDPGIESR